MCTQTRVQAPSDPDLSQCDYGDDFERASEMARLAMAFSGYPVPEQLFLSETASWDQTGAPSVIGQDTILTALSEVSAPDAITLTQIVIEGRAATVSGHALRAGQSHLFCHVLRFTDPSRTCLAQIVSFEHRG
ncbi:hypothetical protein [Celeribacter litoreus]|uniref:hypothetical protein n=1 Tax=Celeribacter litoreus TaxID=2876714 RepID=UPI001CCD00EB|nr:hypothetical protein [Celeribacter litoreus]MCA0042925.1 hypothetical protein [Celeribacter litoreus]